MALLANNYILMLSSPSKTLDIVMEPVLELTWQQGKWLIGQQYVRGDPIETCQWG